MYIHLPNNYQQASRRLTQLKKKLDSDEGYKKEYYAFMNELFEKEQAEKVEKPAETEAGRLWYIPHFGVRHAEKRQIQGSLCR